MFLKHRLDQQYDEINILILGSKKAKYTGVDERTLNFDPQRHVVDLNDLIRETGGLDQTGLERLATLMISNGLSSKAGRSNRVVWVAGLLILFSVGLIVYAVTRGHEQPARLKLALQVGDSPDSLVWFTNSSLSLLRRHNIGSARNPVFTLHANNCLVVPLDSHQSNFVFNFYVRNDSPAAVDNLELGVAVPRTWHGLVDSRWGEARMFMDLPDAEIALTNMHAWATQLPVRLYPTNGYYLRGLEVINVEPPNFLPHNKFHETVLQPDRYGRKRPYEILNHAQTIRRIAKVK